MVISPALSSIRQNISKEYPKILSINPIQNHYYSNKRFKTALINRDIVDENKNDTFYDHKWIFKYSETLGDF